ncbi:TIGR03618 family F420-dependent PPOX class oxidoreductase [Nocardia sp. SYP-A9097]|uniref:PPOX class F420-dependent oxidoreductase n=1 Tax=Nocardia sp. SYP-A9097 TaxID=2663237 RepID=UPI00132B2DA1|nr:PPOX class F420-dependent oxidoreductase [Nocardia sp. SYP-A9097]MRH93275.1 TIGR03618 family F420-dependent PPOX class oxidoreductase [Nocardia sp. SYP-A9097]
MTTLPENLRQHIDKSNVFATVATLGRDGQPHLTVVWLIRDGDDVVFSTTVTRQMYHNLVRDPRVTALINPPENPYVYAEIRGTVTIEPDPERALPNRISQKFTGKPYLEFNPASAGDSARVVVRITPTKVISRI